MKTILVTGATGILGANACTLLIEGGYRARAIARDMAAADVRSLQETGVDVVPGDVTDLNSLLQATHGVDGVIHSAAMLGHPGATWDGCWAANTVGTINVLTAAARTGGAPVVQVLTTTFFSYDDAPLSERSPLDHFFHNNDMYSTTKRLAYTEGFTRAADGQDIRFMIPGAIYGPTVCLVKGLSSSSFNDRIIKGLRGQMPPTLPLPMTWVTARDCAYVCVAALERGERGERYIAHGVPEEATSLAGGVNLACEIAGSPHRTEEISRDQLDSPEMFEKFGPTMPIMAKKIYPKPITDSGFTERMLGYVPTPMAQGFTETLAWMREVGRFETERPSPAPRQNLRL